MKQKRKSEKAGYRKIFLIICLCFWSIYPFISRLVVNTLPDVEKEFFSNNNGYIIDLLMFCKEIALAGFTAAVLLYFIGERIFPDNIQKIDKQRLSKMKLPLIFIGGYALFSIGSFCFSDYKETAFWGVNSEYEGLLAIICYILVFIFGLYYLKPKENGYDSKIGNAGKGKLAGISASGIFRYLIIVLGAITAILTIVEIFYKPILEIPFVQDLISSEKYREIARSIKNENFIGQICLTFNNPGFLGGFCALFIPISFSLSLEEKKVKKWICIISDGILILAVKWSDSKVAMMTTALFLPLTLILSILRIRKIRKKDDGTIISTEEKKNGQKQAVVSFVAVVVLGIVLIVLSKVLPTYSSRTRADENNDNGSAIKEELYKLSKAEIVDGVLKLYSGEKCLIISIDRDILLSCYQDRATADFSEALIFSDGEKELKERIPATLKATTIRGEKAGFKLNDERFSAISISVERELMIIDFGYSGSVEFYLDKEGIKIFGQGSIHLDEIPQPAVTGLESLYSFGTGRGYIWVQSLPLLKDSLLIGGGCGTFAFRFRQNEIVGLLNTHGSCKYVIDRPHNWYLQIALSSGVPALLCVLALFINYILHFIKGFAKQLKTKEKDPNDIISQIRINILDIGLFAGLASFMLCGLINDSCITVNPLFWLFLGWAVSRQYRGIQV